MAKRRITSRLGWFGYTDYFDEAGRYIGRSRPGALGATVYFDKNGKLIGRSHKGFLAKAVFQDVDHKRRITTYDDLVGESHYENGKRIGSTKPGFFGTSYTDWDAVECCQENFEADLPPVWEETEEKEAEPVDYAENIPPTRQTIIKNVQIFLLCIVISVIVGCLLAIIRAC